MPVNPRLRIVLQVSILILLTMPLALWARTTEDEQQQASDEAAKQKELDEIVEKIETLNIDTAGLGMNIDQAERAMAVADKATTEEQEIADSLQRIKDLDPLAGGSQEVCPQTTEDRVGKEGSIEDEKQGKEATEANDGPEKDDGATDTKDKETPEGSAERRAKLYAEITDRLTRIVEKLTAIVDFLNKTLGAIAQQGAVQQPVPQPTDEDLKAKAAEAEAAKAEAAQKAVAEKAAAEKAAAEKEHKGAGHEEAGQAAGEKKAPEGKTTGPQETGEIASTQGEGHTGHIQHEDGNTQGKMTGGEAARKTAGTSPATEAANNAEWQIILSRVERMSERLKKFSESAKRITDLNTKTRILSILAKIEVLFETIRKANGSKLNADDILILNELLDDVEKDFDVLALDLDAQNTINSEKTDASPHDGNKPKAPEGTPNTDNEAKSEGSTFRPKSGASFEAAEGEGSTIRQTKEDINMDGQFRSLGRLAYTAQLGDASNKALQILTRGADDFRPNFISTNQEIKIWDHLAAAYAKKDKSITEKELRLIATASGKPEYGEYFANKNILMNKFKLSEDEVIA